MSEKLKPKEYRDFRMGVIRKTSVADSLVPENSVSHSININYDTIIGKPVVRLGTTLLGATVASGKTPLGLGTFRNAGGSTNNAIAVYSNTSNGTVYYYDTAWNTSTTFDGSATTLSKTAKCRFGTLANKLFMVNGVQTVYYSTDGGNNWTTGDSNVPSTITPTVVTKAKGRLLVGGDTTTAANRNRSRVWFSSVVDSSGSSGAITWDVSSSGNWIDINPDDGDEITAFADTSAVTLVFKNFYTYRLFAISKTVDPDPLFNFGAPSQEAVTICQGIVYFFTGKDIRRTNGSDTSEKLSRYIQEWIDAVPQANWKNVSAGNDGTNVYFSLGQVTVPSSGDDSTTYSNVVLKFSTQDESWSVHAYSNTLTNAFFANYLKTASTNTGMQMIVSDNDGNVQMYNVGTADNTAAISYDLQTQELEFDNRSHIKSITDNIVVFTKYGQDSIIKVKIEDGDFSAVIKGLNERVNIARNVNFSGRWFTIQWTGVATGKSPILEGLYFENVEDQGLANK